MKSLSDFLTLSLEEKRLLEPLLLLKHNINSASFIVSAKTTSPTSSDVPKLLDPADELRNVGDRGLAETMNQAINSPSLFSEAETKTAIDYLNTVNLAPLIKYALILPEVDSFCKYPPFNELWDTRWHACTNAYDASLLSSKELGDVSVDFKYKPQPTLHSFELLKGIFIYANYKIRVASGVEEDKNKANNFLILSAHLGFFAALNTLCKLELVSPSKDTSISLRWAQKAAELYLTPGYLLLAVIYYKQKNYLEALHSLILAKELLPYSRVFINNAYHGIPIEHVIARAFNSWEYGITTLAALADISIANVTEFIYPRIHQAAENIINDLPAIDSSDKLESTRATLK